MASTWSTERARNGSERGRGRLQGAARTLLSCLPFLLIPIPASGDAPAQKDFEPTLWLFPVEHFVSTCPDEVFRWIRDHVGSIEVECSKRQVFSPGQNRTRRDPLIQARLGIHPYVEVNTPGVPRLRVAVSVPPVEAEAVGSFIFKSDQGEYAVPIHAGIRHLTVFGEADSRWVAFELPVDSIGPDDLTQLAQSKAPILVYGTNGDRTLEISPRSLRSIREMVALYKALAKDAGLTR